MVYSDIHNFLPKKAKYTWHDVTRLQIDNLFKGVSMTEKECVFLVKASAVYHGTEYSKTIRDYGTYELTIIK